MAVRTLISPAILALVVRVVVAMEAEVVEPLEQMALQTQVVVAVVALQQTPLELGLTAALAVPVS